jgi:hypothetical protein
MRLEPVDAVDLRHESSLTENSHLTEPRKEPGE